MMWEKVRLVDVCDFQGGTQPPKAEWSSQFKDGYIRMIQIRDYTQAKDNFIEYVKDSKTLKKCNEDDIMIGRYGASIGKILTGLAGAYNVALVKTIPSDQLNKKYFYHYLNTTYFQNFIQNAGSRAAQAGFNKEELKELQIPLPPLPIQKRIAEILDTADTLRRKDEALLKKYDELAQAIFIDLFGDPVKNEKGWEMKKLGNLFKSPVKCGPFGSALKREEFVTFGIPVWNMDNIINYKFSKQCHLFIDDKKYQDLKSYSTQNGDIIISRAGTVGKMCVVDTDIPKSIISTNLIKISLDSNQINPFYFTSLMKYFGKKIGRLRTGSDNGFTHMNTGVLEGLVIPVPPIIQQNVFLEVLKNIECQCQDMTFKSENLFNSLLQKAFNGELVA